MDNIRCDELFPNWKDVNDELYHIIDSAFNFRMNINKASGQVDIGFLFENELALVPDEYKSKVMEIYNKFINKVITDSGIGEDLKDSLFSNINTEIDKIKCKIEFKLTVYQFGHHRTLKDIFLRSYLGVNTLPNLVFKLNCDE